MFKDHYHHKKYEFCENKVLLENIPNIFTSVINSINENNLQSSAQYSYIWRYYALTVGPFCTHKLAKISRKYLSEYFAVSPEVTSKILYYMVLGFLKNICYWNVEDRIEFFKLVALPVICIISTSSILNNFIRFDQIMAKSITPFVDNIHEYKMIEIRDLSYLFFCILECCPFITKKWPMYSNEIETKTIEIFIMLLVCG